MTSFVTNSKKPQNNRASQIFGSTHSSTLEGKMSIETTYPTPLHQQKLHRPISFREHVPESRKSDNPTARPYQPIPSPPTNHSAKAPQYASYKI